MDSHANLTVVTKSHLPFARVLMSRLQLLNPEARQYVFFVDNPDECFNPVEEPFRVVAPSEYVDEAELRSMTFQYTAFELCNALRPYAHRFISRYTNHETWAYFDCDIVPVASVKCLFDEESNASVYLTPHILFPVSVNHIEQDVLFLSRGIFNSGWLGIRRSPEAESFIDWFIERCRNHCFSLYRGLFVDQLWLNFVPVIFPGSHIVRHTGANIAYWNMHERVITENSNGEIEANGEKAIFLHFSGWDPAHPKAVSKYSPELVFPAPLQEVADSYAQELQSSGLSDSRRWQYSWGRYTDGQEIRNDSRRKYAGQCLDGTWPATDDPFGSPKRLSPWPGTPWSNSLRTRLGRWIRRV
jgi:hypothetical protein